MLCVVTTYSSLTGISKGKSSTHTHTHTKYNIHRKSSVIHHSLPLNQLEQYCILCPHRPLKNSAYKRQKSCSIASTRYNSKYNLYSISVTYYISKYYSSKKKKNLITSL